jgi:hypothetical protein
VIWIFSHTKIHPNTFFEANVGLIPFINHQEFFITKEIALASYYIRLKALPLLAINLKKNIDSIHGSSILHDVSSNLVSLHS